MLQVSQWQGLNFKPVFTSIVENSVDPYQPAFKTVLSWVWCGFKFYSKCLHWEFIFCFYLYLRPSTCINGLITDIQVNVDMEIRCRG